MDESWIRSETARLFDRHYGDRRMTMQEAEETRRRIAVSLMERAFRQEVEPLVEQKAHVASLFMPPIIIGPNGIEHGTPSYPPETAAALAQVDALLAEIEARYKRLVEAVLGEPVKG